jgi:hypothetical protein
VALLTHAYKLDIPLVAMEKKQHCQDWPVEVVHLMYYMYMYVYLVGGQGAKEDWKVNRRNQRHQNPKHQNSKYLTYVAWHSGASSL